MTTVPFHRHPTHPVLEVLLWIAFMLAAILALLVVLGIVGTRPADPDPSYTGARLEGRNT